MFHYALCACPVLACAIVAFFGCTSRPPVPTLKDTPGTGPVTNPFVPASMIIHPLMRIDTDAGGRLWLFCHVEFKDSWGDAVKATGSLQVQLYRTTGSRASGPGLQELVWTINLSDLQQNASLYDPATRTYRLPLENPPAWLGQIAAGAPRPHLKAVMVTGGVREGTRKLEAEFVL